MAFQRLVVRQLDELADALQRLARVQDQRLVADLQVVGVPQSRAPRTQNAPPPVGRLRLHLAPGREPHPAQRERHVAPVADEVDEARLGKHAPDGIHLQAVERRLVAPARLAEALRVQPVERPEPLRRGEGGDLPESAPERFQGNLEVGPDRRRFAAGGDGVEEPFAQPVPAPAQLRRERQEAGLRRDRQLGMRIQHEPQQRRPRPRRPDDDRHRRPQRLRRAPPSPPRVDHRRILIRRLRATGPHQCRGRRGSLHGAKDPLPPRPQYCPGEGRG